MRSEEDTAKAWEILLTDSVCAELAGRPEFDVQPLPDAPPGAKAAFRLVYRA